MKSALTCFAILACLSACPVSAQQARNCGPRDLVVERLAEMYGETRQAMGLGANRQVLEVFAAETGTWTITITGASGITCLVASGQAYEALDEALPEPGSEL